MTPQELEHLRQLLIDLYDRLEGAIEECRRVRSVAAVAIKQIEEASRD